MTLQEQIDAVVAAHPFGKASAARRGRRSEWPYVPVIDYGERQVGPKSHTEQIRGRAFDSRENAVAYAQAVIDARRQHMRAQLLVPRMRAFREQHGLPSEI